RRLAAAERVLSALHERMPALPQVAIARARLLEWSLGDLATARRLVAEALAGLPPGSPYRTDLEGRAARPAAPPRAPPRRRRLVPDDRVAPKSVAHTGAW